VGERSESSLELAAEPTERRSSFLSEFVLQQIYDSWFGHLQPVLARSMFAAIADLGARGGIFKKHGQS
jgi:hypothetical protein